MTREKTFVQTLRKTLSIIKKAGARRRESTPRAKLIILLNALIFTCLAVILLIFLTGGVVIAPLGFRISMRHYGNPLMLLLAFWFIKRMIAVRKKDILSLLERFKAGAVKAENIFAVSFFALFLLIGVLIYKDYGISIDEPRERLRGEETLRYAQTGNWDLPSWHDPFHGQSFVLLLAAAEKWAGFTEYEFATAAEDPVVREAYQFRHLLNFLFFFASTVFFYLLMLKVFGSWKPAALGSLLLIISPRIFGHSFFNPKDLPFMSAFIISIYTLLNLLDRRTIRAAGMHAFACAFLTGIRVLGLIVPLLTVIFFALDSFFSGRPEQKAAYKAFGAYAGLLVFFTILVWPILWEEPFANLAEAFSQMRMYPWKDYVFYRGEYILSSNLPRHYLPVWIAATTPASYLFFFAAGAVFAFALQFRKNTDYIRKRNMLILLSWPLPPLLALILLQPVLYDGWRQAYFIYPGMLALAVLGISGLYERFKTAAPILRKTGLVLAAFFLADIFSTACFMVKFHPYQHVYFNRSISGGMERAKENFEMDYWGLSAREGLEYLLDNDDSKSIAVFSDVLRAPETNARMIPPGQRERLEFINCFSKLDEADYYITHYRHPSRKGALAVEGRIDPENPYFQIDIRGARILGVYEVIHKENSF